MQTVLKEREEKQELWDLQSVTLARLDQTEARHQELEAEREDLKGINAGLRDENEWLKTKPGDKRE